MFRVIAAALLVMAFACGGGSTGPSGSGPSPTATPARVLMLTATAGFRHESIPTARQVMSNLATSGREFTVTAIEDLSTITAATLADYDVVMFALTTGELPFTADQKSALVTFVSGGRGFIGVHSASDTLYDWPDYGRLVGAYFKEHPWTMQGTVIVEDPGHPTMAGQADRFTLLEEFYTFRQNPRPNVHVILRLDPASVGASGDFPLAWVNTFGSGRTYYNALGHFSETWNDPRFQRQMAAAIKWVSGR